MVGHTLVVARHAKSDWSTGLPDIDRPLAARGRRQAPESGRWIADRLADLDVARISPAQRARSTWELIAGELGDRAPAAEVEPDLYFADAMDVVRALPETAASAIVVGHNPDLEDLVERLTGEWVELKTSALAVIDLPGRWADAGTVRASLRAAGRPPG